MSEPLSPADRGALTAEQGPINMAVAGAMIFDAATYEAVLERVRERLHLLPRYRQRLADPFGPLTNPVWVDDDGFDLEWHVRHARLPDGDLAGYVAREMATRLHRDRPLWELHVIDGLAEGKVAVLPKMHHALVDGLAAIGVGMILLDPTPEPLPVDAAPEWLPRSFDRRQHLSEMATAPVAIARGLLGRALDMSPRRAAEELRRTTELATELARQRPQAPMTVLNEPLSPNRRYAMRRADLAAIKTAGKAAGGTVNDAVLAVVAGALGRFVGTDRDLVALVPVSVRKDADDPASGNHISTVFVDLPVGEPHLAARIRVIGAQMRELRASAAVRAGALFVGAAGVAPPIVAGVMARAMGGVRAMNLVVSNVPGPQQTFYMNGAPLREVYPAVPLNPANQSLNVGVMSYDGGVYFGLCADKQLDVDGVATALDAALAELTA